jgi:hypothetical protein
MKFWLQIPGTMAIDNCLISGLTFPGLPPDIYMVNWDGVTNKGELEYKNAMPIRTPFLDPSPYLPYVNAWIIKGQTQTPPINLPQAKTIKQDVVETLFNYKRQLPIAVVTIGWTFAATDEDTTSMNRYLSSVSTLSVNNVVAQLKEGINAQFVYLSGDLNDKLNRDSTVTGITSTGTFSGSGTAPADGGPMDVSGTTSQVAVAGKSTFTTIVTPAVEAPVINYPEYLFWVPLGSTTTVGFTVDQFCLILSAIEERRASLNSVRLTKREEIDGLATIAAVAAYDVTSGW